jgi:hypothetical protein
VLPEDAAVVITRRPVIGKTSFVRGSFFCMQTSILHDAEERKAVVQGGVARE